MTHILPYTGFNLVNGPAAEITQLCKSKQPIDQILWARLAVIKLISYSALEAAGYGLKAVGEIVYAAHQVPLCLVSKEVKPLRTLQEAGSSAAHAAKLVLGILGALWGIVQPSQATSTHEWLALTDPKGLLGVINSLMRIAPSENQIFAGAGVLAALVAGRILYQPRIEVGGWKTRPYAQLLFGRYSLIGAGVTGACVIGLTAYVAYKRPSKTPPLKPPQVPPQHPPQQPPVTAPVFQGFGNEGPTYGEWVKCTYPLGNITKEHTVIYAGTDHQNRTVTFGTTTIPWGEIKSPIVKTDPPEPPRPSTPRPGDPTGDTSQPGRSDSEPTPPDGTSVPNAGGPESAAPGNNNNPAPPASPVNGNVAENAADKAKPGDVRVSDAGDKSDTGKEDSDSDASVVSRTKGDEENEGIEGVEDEGVEGDEDEGDVDDTTSTMSLDKLLANATQTASTSTRSKSSSSTAAPLAAKEEKKPRDPATPAGMATTTTTTATQTKPDSKTSKGGAPDTNAQRAAQNKPDGPELKTPFNPRIAVTPGGRHRKRGGVEPFQPDREAQADTPRPSENRGRGGIQQPFNVNRGRGGKNRGRGGIQQPFKGNTQIGRGRGGVPQQYEGDSDVSEGDTEVRRGGRRRHWRGRGRGREQTSA